MLGMKNKLFDIIEKSEVKVKGIKHSVCIYRYDDDSYSVSIIGPDRRSEVSLLIRALEKEVSRRARQAVPLSDSITLTSA